MTAKEKQATQSGICFSCGINEQMSDEIGQRALKARVCEYDIMSASEPEQTQPVQGERRMAIMSFAHDIIFTRKGSRQKCLF